MSRFARTRAEPTTSAGRTPFLICIVYGLGLLAALILIVSALFTAGGYYGSDDTAVDVSPVAIVVWGGLLAVAVGTWLWRRLRGRR